jgi:hypothetical protein
MVIHEEKQQASSMRHAPHIKATALAAKTNLKHVKDT